MDLVASLRRPSEILLSVGNPEPMWQTHQWRAQWDVDGVIQPLVAMGAAAT